MPQTRGENSLFLLVEGDEFPHVGKERRVGIRYDHVVIIQIKLLLQCRQRPFCRGRASGWWSGPTGCSTGNGQGRGVVVPLLSLPAAGHVLSHGHRRLPAPGGSH